MSTATTTMALTTAAWGTAARGTAARGTAAQGTRASTWVDAAPFRAHLRHLMAVSSLSSSAVALLAGLSPAFAFRLLHGRGGRPLRRISPETARQLLRITTAEARAVRSRSVPAASTQQHLRRLLEHGYPAEELAERLDVPPSAVEALLTAQVQVCPQLLALRVAAEVSRWQRPWPEAVAGRVAVRAAVRAAA